MHLIRRSTNFSVRVKSIYRRSILVFFTFVLTFATTLPVQATQNATSYTIPSTHLDPTDLRFINNELWYLYRDSSGNPAYPYRYHIAHRTQDGTTVTYNLRELTNNPTLQASNLIVGPDGNIWFGVWDGMPRVGMLNISTGTATVYGTGNVAGGYYAPLGLVAGVDGNIWYTVEHHNKKHSIMRVSLVDSTVTEMYYYNDTYGDWYGLSTTADGSLWFTDNNYKRIYSYNILTNSWDSSYNMSQLSVSMTYAYDYVLGPDHNLWFAGSYTDAGVTSYKVFKKTSNGTFSEYVLPTGVIASSLATGSDGAIWFVNNGSSKGIGRISTSGNITTYAAPIGSTNANSLTLGSDGSIWYFSKNSGIYGIEKLIVTPDFTSYSIPSTHLDPTDLRFINNDLWYLYRDSSGSPGSTYRFHVAHRTLNGVTTTYNLRELTNSSTLQASNLIAGPDGNIWFGAWDGMTRVGMLNISTGTVTLYGSSNASGYYPPLGIVAGPDGNIWYTVEHHNKKHSIMRVNPTTGAVTQMHYYNDTYGDWYGLSITPDGNLWFTDNNYKRIYSYSTLTNSWGSSYQMNQLPISMTYAYDFVADSSGDLWFTGYFANSGITTYKVFKRTSSGVFSEYILPSGVRASLLTLGTDGAIWFANTGNPKGIGRITTSGDITTYPSPTGTSNVSSTITGPDGAIWFISTNGTAKSIVRLGY